MNQRLERLRQLLDREKIEALVVCLPENRRYLSGFTGSAGVLVVGAQRALLATDFRYYEQARRQAPDFELVELAQSMAKGLASLIGERGFKRLGFESHVLTVEEFGKWKTAVPEVEWVPTSGLIEELRQIKGREELRAIEAAVGVADEAMCHAMEWIRPGMTEREVSWELEVYIRTHGADELSFTTIVGSGPNGAMSHAVTSDRPIGIGDPIVIDMGARCAGYCSDLTRSFCLGEASDDYLAAWNTVLRAQLAAEEALVGDMSGAEADAVARRIIDDAGYQGKFGHGLGHGVGLAIHEAPRAGQTSEDTLRIGTILTVEPGIYVPGWGGVRIEDMVVVTETGCRVLTQAPKQPVVSPG